MELVRLFIAPLVTAILVSVITALLQHKVWNKQKATEQKISLIHEWESFVGAAEYAFLFEETSEPHPEIVRLLLTRQKGLITTIQAVFSSTDTSKAVDSLQKELAALGSSAWFKSKQPHLSEMRDNLLEQMNREVFS